MLSFCRIQIFLTVPDTHYTSIIYMCRHLKCLNIHRLFHLYLHMYVSCTVGKRKAAVATGCQVMRNERGHNAETLTLETSGPPLRRSQFPLTAAERWALTGGEHRQRDEGALKGMLQKRAGCVPLGPRQLSDTIAYTAQKRVYKDTRLYTREKT